MPLCNYMRFVYHLIIISVLILSCSLSFASSSANSHFIPSFTEFSAVLNQNLDVSCDLRNYLNFFNRNDLEAIKVNTNDMPSNEVFNQDLAGFINLTLYEGIHKLNKVNPKLAQFIISNVAKKKIDIICTHKHKDHHGVAHYSAFLGMEAFAKRTIDFGGVLYLALEDFYTRFNANSTEMKFFKNVLFHEFLHFYLSKKSYFSHDTQKYRQLLWGPDDLVYDCSSVVFPVANNINYGQTYNFTQALQLLKTTFDSKSIYFDTYLSDHQKSFSKQPKVSEVFESLRFRLPNHISCGVCASAKVKNGKVLYAEESASSKNICKQHSVSINPWKCEENIFLSNPERLGCQLNQKTIDAYNDLYKLYEH